MRKYGKIGYIKEIGKRKMKIDIRKLLSLLLVLLIVLAGCGVRGNDSLSGDQTEQATQGSIGGGETESSEQVTSSDMQEQTEREPIDITEGEEFLSDPYENVDKEEFYKNYEPAQSVSDAYYRTLHGLMSGDIYAQDQKPSLAKNQPMDGDKYIRNTATIYSDSGDIYYILNSEGEIVDRIYEAGAYTTLEEVAAYVLAFGDVPPNYAEGKKTSPKSSIWGEYLRVNHSEFSGNTKKYPYEPKLPNISGCGGSFQYFEIDIGTTGTDCDPHYAAAIYNNGSSIVRGAARIVYASYDRNGNGKLDANERYVFYTYNHYNDFQEYLNYWGGWGEMFGNVTGGGELSSKTNYNPTQYVEVERADFSAFAVVYADSGKSCDTVYISFVCDVERLVARETRVRGIRN